MNIFGLPRAKQYKKTEKILEPVISTSDFRIGEVNALGSKKYMDIYEKKNFYSPLNPPDIRITFRRFGKTPRVEFRDKDVYYEHQMKMILEITKDIVEKLNESGTYKHEIKAVTSDKLRMELPKNITIKIRSSQTD